MQLNDAYHAKHIPHAMQNNTATGNAACQHTTDAAKTVSPPTIFFQFSKQSFGIST